MSGGGVLMTSQCIPCKNRILGLGKNRIISTDFCWEFYYSCALIITHTHTLCCVSVIYPQQALKLVYWRLLRVAKNEAVVISWFSFIS